MQQYLWAREEVANCSAQFYSEGRKLLRAFAERATITPAAAAAAAAAA
jgi:hypothetical protein